MVDVESRIQQAIDEITGNEALLEMLETEAAAEMLEWGKSMVTALVNQTQDLEETVLDARLKQLRQFIRTVGNWAAGKYADPADRVQLRDKLLGQYKAIYGAEVRLPAPDHLEAVLNQTADPGNSPQQLILNLRQLFNESH
jgi:hypothetical protein